MLDFVTDDSYISRVRGPSSRLVTTTEASRRAPRELLADRAYADLRDRIVTLRIAPGEPIDEDLLGAELGIGRTPVREAIKRLALENLVTVFPRRGNTETRFSRARRLIASRTGVRPMPSSTPI